MATPDQLEDLQLWAGAELVSADKRLQELRKIAWNFAMESITDQKHQERCYLILELIAAYKED